MRTLKEILDNEPIIKKNEVVFHLPTQKFGIVEDIFNYHYTIEIEGIKYTGYWQDKKNRTLFTIKEAKDLGFEYYPFGEVCVFWNDYRGFAGNIHVSLTIGKLNEVWEKNGNLKYLAKCLNTDEKNSFFIAFENYKLLSDAFNDVEFCKKWNLK